MDQNRYLRLRSGKGYIRSRLIRRIEEVEKTLFPIVPLNFAGRLLDLGSFDGQLGLRLGFLFKNLTIVGLDLSFSGHLMQNMICCLGDGRALPFKEESFDIIVATAVLEHVPDPAVFISEAGRALRSGGQLILTFPNPVWDAINSAIKDTGHKNSFFKPQLLKILEKNGFSVKEYRGFMALPFASSSTLVKKIESIMLRMWLDKMFFNRIVSAFKVAG